MNTRLHSLSLVALAALVSCASTETDRDLFLQADTNHDQKLSLDEVNRVGIPRLFNRFDLNADGVVTLAEAREVEPSFEEKVFNERDTNHDGKVSYEENEKVALSKGGLKKQFSSIDSNGDLFIDKAEADAYVAKSEQTSTSN